MNGKPVEYHEGARADVKSAVSWYQKHSSKAASDFVEELHRAASTICESPDRWPLGKNNKTVSSLAIPLFDHLFGAEIHNHNLGGCPWQRTA